LTEADAGMRVIFGVSAETSGCGGTAMAPATVAVAEALPLGRGAWRRSATPPWI
jgi:hypothetical protein